MREAFAFCPQKFYADGINLSRIWSGALILLLHAQILLTTITDVGERLCPLDGTILETYIYRFFPVSCKITFITNRICIGNSRYLLVKGSFSSNEARYN